MGHSHVSELWLPPDQHVSDPVNLKQLPLDVVHGDGGVRHRHHVLVWEGERKLTELKSDLFMEKKYSIKYSMFELSYVSYLQPPIVCESETQKDI